MFTGFKFMSNTQVLSTPGLEVFKYYTVDSNILVGMASLLLIIYEVLYMKKRISIIPKWVYLLKYICTVAVTLTFFVTLIYLSPVYGWFLYQNAYLFFHLIIPLISLISFVLFEKADFNWKDSFYGISTMIAYSIFYTTNILIYEIIGEITSKYDWYGFVKGGPISMIISLIIMIGFTYLISWRIYYWNKRS